MKLDNREGLLMQRQRSQSLVEFSLSLVALAMLVSGLLDLGRLYFIYTAMEDIVGEGVLYMSLNPQCTTNLSTAGSTSCVDPNNALYRMRNAGSGILAFDTDATAVGTLVVSNIPGYGGVPVLNSGEFRIRMCFPDPYSGTPFEVAPGYCPNGAANNLGAGAGHTVMQQETVYVEMHYGFKLLTPFMPAIAGINPLRLSVAAVAYALVED